VIPASSSRSKISGQRAASRTPRQHGPLLVIPPEVPAIMYRWFGALEPRTEAK
jgi:hypothetical protein